MAQSQLPILGCDSASQTPIPPALSSVPLSQPPPPPPAVISNGTTTTAGTSSTAAEENIKIAIPDPSIVSNTALISELTHLINTVYTAAEEGLFSPAYRRTFSDEVVSLVQKGELALAWRASLPPPNTFSLPSSDNNSDNNNSNSKNDDVKLGSIVGCVRIHSLSPSHGDFGMLVCDPALRGSGTGRSLVRFAEQHCKEQGKTTMQCELLVSIEFDHPFKRRMQGWYERMGYKVVRHGDFNAEYPHIAPHLVTQCEYRVFEKPLI
ncbi:hypothetical protein QBC46DRAFT_392927 [Diplogelasinospora grovesii]|uniref:N-acetyltransferase domain-containing protein n=1 Tax=Diplogelasinospora grovesii TaxID=303347 RepID=A0AAN6N246_9PEZI|nr:hypothetical protein QBC46DRAFT_392927 [Diplogelasinospora grovesii]